MTVAKQFNIAEDTRKDDASDHNLKRGPTVRFLSCSVGQPGTALG